MSIKAYLLCRGLITVLFFARIFSFKYPVITYRRDDTFHITKILWNYNILAESRRKEQFGKVKIWNFPASTLYLRMKCKWENGEFSIQQFTIVSIAAIIPISVGVDNEISILKITCSKSIFFVYILAIK